MKKSIFSVTTTGKEQTALASNIINKMRETFMSSTFTLLQAASLIVRAHRTNNLKTTE